VLYLINGKKITNVESTMQYIHIYNIQFRLIPVLVMSRPALRILTEENHHDAELDGWGLPKEVASWFLTNRGDPPPPWGAHAALWAGTRVSE
jgi:hypothetical protein